MSMWMQSCRKKIHTYMYTADNASQLYTNRLRVDFLNSQVTEVSQMLRIRGIKRTYRPEKRKGEGNVPLERGKVSPLGISTSLKAVARFTRRLVCRRTRV